MIGNLMALEERPPKNQDKIRIFPPQLSVNKSVKDIGLMVKEQVMVELFGMTDIGTKETSKIIIEMDKVLIIGKMELITKENGKMTNKMDLELCIMQTVQ